MNDKSTTTVYRDALIALFGSDEPEILLSAKRAMLAESSEGFADKIERITAALDKLCEPPIRLSLSRDGLIAWRDRLRKKNGFLVLAKSDRRILEELIALALS